MINKLLGIAGDLRPDVVKKEYSAILLDDETVEAGFKVIRDMFIFTDIRLIIVDVQGMTGRKKEYLSIPYSKITMFSVESAGHFDLEAELKIWVGSHSTPIEKKFNTKVDVYQVQKILAWATSA